MASELSPEHCIICQQDTGDALQHVKGKGLGTLTDASEARGLLELHGYLLSSPSDVYVHSECRKYFIDLRKIKL